MRKKKLSKEDMFVDYRGYPRFKKSKRLVHRWMAEKEIYGKDTVKDSLPFEEYQVHHVDKDKWNFRPENLKILMPREHEEIHGKVRTEWVIIYMFGFIVVISFLLSLFERFANSNNFSSIIKIFGFSTITLVGFLVFWLFTKETKKRKYI